MNLLPSTKKYHQTPHPLQSCQLHPWRLCLSGNWTQRNVCHGISCSKLISHCLSISLDWENHPLILCHGHGTVVSCTWSKALVTIDYLHCLETKHTSLRSVSMIKFIDVSSCNTYPNIFGKIISIFGILYICVYIHIYIYNVYMWYNVYIKVLLTFDNSSSQRSAYSKTK